MNDFAYITLDAETWLIQQRPAYPPRPVGWSIKWPGAPSRYYAFGHASENNCDEDTAKRAVLEALASDHFLLFHGGKFDVDVLCTWLGIDLRDPRLHWTRLHDSSFTAFLCDPHALNHGLKELAAQHLNWPADEKDEIAVWVWDHRLQLNYTAEQNGWRDDEGKLLKVKRSNTKTSDGSTKASNAMEFIPYVPGDLAGKYAEGDTDRTSALFDLMYKYVVDNDMLYAYDTERELMPILLENEQEGIYIDLPLLTQETELYMEAMEHVERCLRERLDAPDLNFDADQEYAMALIRAGIVREEQFERTPKKKEFKVGKDSLTPDMFADPFVASAMGYRNRLKTCLTMFMQPWLEQGTKRNGVISTNWNQTRGGDGGTRTGRPSTYDPNFLNISKNFEDRPDGYVHPDFLNVPKLPLVRKYMLPDPGCYWLHRDFSGQELRVFANYEGECWPEDQFERSLLAAYQKDPALDPHGWVRENLSSVVPKFMPDPSWDADKTKAFLKHLRTQIKITNFRRIYGGGVGATQQALGISRQEAQEFCAFHDQALPGRKLLDDECKKLARFGQPIRTWAGRMYYVEDPIFKDGRLVNFEYKLINYKVQGSAADITKRSIIDWYNDNRRSGSRFLVTVYDENNIASPIDRWKEEMAILREQMCMPRLNCPMLSDGKYGERWGALQECD
ncbi:hypothetical protein GC167_05935 [bacterium]|nr:hypothetical protein [bacterium]